MDGYRAIVEVSHGELVAVWSKRGGSLLSKYPAIGQVPSCLRRRSVLLDGELVGFDADGAPRFQRMQLGSNVVLFVFDVLGVGQSLVIEERYDVRRRRLEELHIADGRWRTVDVFDDGMRLFEATRKKGLEGVVSKRRDSKYESGRTTGSWIKTVHPRQEATYIVGGWLPASNDPREVGSLLVGEFDDEGKLIYRGRVAGFDDEELLALRDALTPARQPLNPFATGPLPREARFLVPAIRVRVAYREVTDAGQLRSPTFVAFDIEPHIYQKG